MGDITRNSHPYYYQRITLFVRWILASTFGWLVMGVLFIGIDMLIQNVISPLRLSGSSKTAVNVLIGILLLSFPLLLGFLHWKVLSPTRYNYYRWMAGYLIVVFLGFIIGSLVSEWFYPNPPEVLNSSYFFFESLPYYLSLGLGIGIAQFYLLRSEIRFPFLLVISTTLGILLAYDISMSSWGYRVGRQYSPELHGLILFTVMGAVANSLTGILATLLPRRHINEKQSAA